MSFKFSEIIKPRITDINYGGHLGHMEIIGLLHEVRAQFLRKNGLSELEIEGCVLFMKKLSINYTNQAYWDNELQVKMVLKTDKAKIIFQYEILNLNLNNVTADAEATMVLVDRLSQKIIKPHLFFQKVLHNSS